MTKRAWLALSAFLMLISSSPASAANTSSATGESPYNLPGKTPFLMAHYMPWFTLDHPRIGTPWSAWKWDGKHPHDPTHWLDNGRRDIASILYPLIGPYDNTLPEVVRYHLETMHAAGISGIIIDWSGKGSYGDAAYPMYLEEANRLGMRIAICYEEKTAYNKSVTSRQQMMDNAVRNLSYLLNNWAKSPAYLRRDGKPWIMQFNAYGPCPLGSKAFSPAEMSDIMARLPEPVAYVRQGLDSSYAPAVSGGYLWAPEITEGNAAKQFGMDAAKLRAGGQLQFFMSRLCVGFNDSGVWGWGKSPRISRLYGQGVLEHAETQALIGGPELIQCVTWNDFNEATCFEPTVQYGFSWLDEVARFAGKMRHQPMNLKAIREPFEQYVQTCSPQERQELPKVDPSVLQP